MKFICPTCGKEFRTIESMRRHHERVHRTSLQIPRGISGIQGMAGKVILDEKHKFKEILWLPDASRPSRNLGNVVTFGNTNEQFQDLQQAINEVAKVASSGSHGEVLVTEGNYYLPETLSLPSYVDLFATLGRPFVGTTSGNVITVGELGAGATNRISGLEIEADDGSAAIELAGASTLYLYDCNLHSIEPSDPAQTLNWTIEVHGTVFRDDINFPSSAVRILSLWLFDCHMRFADILVPDGQINLKIFNSRCLFSKIQAEGSGIQIHIKDSILYSLGDAPLSLDAANITTGINRTSISHCLLCAPTNTVENISGGIIELWTSNNQLQTGYSVGTNENIAASNNVVDAEFLIACQTAW